MVYEIRFRETSGKKIYVDPIDTDGIYLYPAEIKKLGLTDGGEITDEILDACRKTITIPRAKKRALGILAKRDKTEQELREKLLESFNDAMSLEAAIDFAKSCDYINDYRYAEDYIYSKRKRKSFRMLRMDLQQKGISQEILEMVFEEYHQNPDDLRDAVYKYARKYPEMDRASVQKIQAHFVRKGYESGLVRHLLEEYREHMEEHKEHTDTYSYT